MPGSRSSTALQAFLGETQGEKPSSAAIAISAPVVEGVSALTNRSGWTLERHALSKLGVQAKLINDFQALAYGVAHAALALFVARFARRGARAAQPL